jgi:hypothetical protein
MPLDLHSTAERFIGNLELNRTNRPTVLADIPPPKRNRVERPPSEISPCSSRFLGGKTLPCLTRCTDLKFT